MVKRKLPPHIVLPDGRWRFVKKGSKSKKIKKPTYKYRRIGKTMARKKSYRRRAIGGAKTMLAPIVGGAGDVIATKFIPVAGVGSTVAGMFLKDQVTMKIGLNKIGESLAVMFAGNGGGNGGGL